MNQDDVCSPNSPVIKPDDIVQYMKKESVMGEHYSFFVIISYAMSITVRSSSSLKGFRI
jgi:hypothetical protein